MNKMFYNAPIIKVEELEKADVLCASTTTTPEVKENSQNTFSEISGRMVFDDIPVME